MTIVAGRARRSMAFPYDDNVVVPILSSLPAFGFLAATMSASDL